MIVVVSSGGLGLITILHAEPPRGVHAGDRRRQVLVAHLRLGPLAVLSQKAAAMVRRRRFRALGVTFLYCEALRELLVGAAARVVSVAPQKLFLALI